MKKLKDFLKTTPAKIGMAVICIALVLTAAFLLQPSPSRGEAASGQNRKLEEEAGSQDKNAKDKLDSFAKAEMDKKKESDKKENADSADASQKADDRKEPEDEEASKRPENGNEAGASQEPEKPQKPENPGGGTEADPDTGKDQYQTDPVPEGKPEPVEPKEAPEEPSTEYTCTISIRCDAILNNMDLLNPDKAGMVPGDGAILGSTTVTFSEGESVFDVLKRVTREQRIHMESEFTPMYNSAYIEGINNLYEFDCGNLSGWMYKVNGWFPNYGCSRYSVQNGDVIEWVYTCDMGQDIGGSNVLGGE